MAADNRFSQITVNGPIYSGTINLADIFYPRSNPSGYGTGVGGGSVTQAQLDSVSGWTNSIFVHRTGNEVITGLKTFANQVAIGGFTNPDEQLCVSGETNVRVKLQTSGFYSAGYILRNPNQTYGFILEGTNTASIYDYTAGAYRMSFTGGNVGIATITPSAKLDVNGTVNITGNVGIGTASPNPIGLLTVNGNILQDRSGDALYYFIDRTNNSGTYNGFSFQRNRSDGVASEKWFVGLQPNSNTFRFGGEGGVNALNLTSSGNVGIGTVTPIASLHVSNNTGIAPARFEKLNSISSYIEIAASGVTGYWSANGVVPGNGDYFVVNSQSGRANKIFRVAYETDPDTLTWGPYWVMRGYSGTANTDDNKGFDLIMGYNTGYDFSYIQTIHQNVGYKPLILQPVGGYVGIGTTGGTTTLSIHDNTAGSSAAIRMTFGGIPDAAGRGAFIDCFNNGDARVGALETTGALVLYAGQAARAYISSGGNVGVGISNPTSPLVISGAFDANPTATGNGNASPAILRIATTNLVGMDFGIQGTTSPFGGWIQMADTRRNGNGQYPISLQPSGGNVGIGMMNPKFPLNIKQSGANTVTLKLSQTTSDNGWGMYSDNGNGDFSLGYEQGTYTERFRITNGGHVLIGNSTDNGNLYTYNTNTSFPALRVDQNVSTATSSVSQIVHNATAGDNVFIQFYTEASPTLRGSISYNRAGGVAAYNTTSDKRLKINVSGLSGIGEKIDAIKPSTWDWKLDNTMNRGVGFIAQELIDIIPEAVTSGDSDPNILPNDSGYQSWGVDMSKIVPYLVAEIQSMRKRITHLESLVDENNI